MIIIKRSKLIFFFFASLKCQDIFIHTFNKYIISLADYIKLGREEI